MIKIMLNEEDYKRFFDTINDLDTFKEDSDIPNQEPFDETREQIQSMKEKALEIQRILNEQTVDH